MTDDQPDDDALASELIAGLKGMGVASVAADPQIAQLFLRLDRVAAAATIGGLLTQPELQANCLRLEALAHAALATCKGSRRPRRFDIESSFARAGQLCGHLEDPSEDTFSSIVTTRQGDFRIIEGSWESAAFYLQRCLNVLEALGDLQPAFLPLMDSCTALLRLSELTCARAGIGRNVFGAFAPVERLPHELAKRLEEIGHLVQFTPADLATCGIDEQHLAPYALDLSTVDAVSEEPLDYSLLERRPVIRHGSVTYLILPTAVSIAIRSAVLEASGPTGIREVFLGALALDYAKHFARTPLLGSRARPEIEFKRTEHGLLSGIAQEVDVGRSLNIIFMVDTLEGFEERGFVGAQAISGGVVGDIQSWIDHVAGAAVQLPRYRSGITLLVGCGVGRGLVAAPLTVEYQNWRVLFVGAPMLSTIGWGRKIAPLHLWRLFEAQDKLRTLGVELHNLNGLLNLVAWADSLDGHLVPHGLLPDDAGLTGKLNISVDQTALLAFRREVLSAWDTHSERDENGKWVLVQQEGRPLVPPQDPRLHIYATVNSHQRGKPRAVVIGRGRTWWADVEGDRSGPATYDRWKTVATWLARSAAVLEDHVEGLPLRPIVWKAVFAVDPADRDDRKIPKPAPYDECRAHIHVTTDPRAGVVITTADEVFERGIFNPENVAERSLVDAFVEGVIGLVSGDLGRKEELVNLIVPDPAMRHTHAFVTRSFRDYVEHTLPDDVIGIDEVDVAALKLGLGWNVRSRSDGGSISGKDECVSLLNRLVAYLGDELRRKLNGLQRGPTLWRLLKNHEAAVVNRNRWRKTAAAMLAMSDDRNKTLKAIGEHDQESNGVSLATRIAIECAICECPVEGAAVPGKLELSQVLALASCIFHLGGWSDAIKWDVMEPKLRITALGDVQGNLGYVEEVMQPFAVETHEERLERDVEDYAENLQERIPVATVVDAFEPAFLEAWIEQFGVSVDDTRHFVDVIEDAGIRGESAVLRAPRSTLMASICKLSKMPESAVQAILDGFTLPTRSDWRLVPPGFDEADRQPWRFRRRLSVVRRPVLQTTGDADPLLLLAPGMLRDSIVYVLGNYYRGDFPHRQLSPLMRKWAGHVARERGDKFSEKVAARLRELGWEAQSQVRVTKILKMGFDEDFGDVDVLAWNRVTRRVLVIECKDVQYRKTYGEIAEQLADFRGEMKGDGKPDDLLRHLKRVLLLSHHLKIVAAYLGIESISALESHLVFKNPVPVTYALAKMRERVQVRTFKELANI